jgi:hypothetical protein
MVFDKLRLTLNVICLSCLMLDSGGALGLRNLSFIIIILFAAYGILTNFTINKLFIFLYFVFLISIIPGVVTSLLDPKISVNVIFGWIASFLLVPIFFLYINGSKLTHRAFVISGTLFAILIIVLFTGRLYGISFVNSFNDYLKDKSPGFFGDKGFASGDILPNVYFQGTLSLVICAILGLENKNYFSYIIILIALILAPSRFGFLVLILWAFIIFLRRSPIRILFIPAIVVLGFAILNSLPFGKELVGIFNGQSDGIDVRNGHIESIFYEFKTHPLTLFTGEGPGSIFYTKGTGGYGDNIELSQFEYLRKYGIISFVIFTVVYFFPLLGKRKNTFFIKGTLVMYYIVSFSNPVLYSIFAMLFLTYAYLKILSNNLHQPYKAYENHI